MATLPPTDPAAGALPVALHLADPVAGAVRRWVEGTLGWQPIDGATASLVPPAVVLCDLGAAAEPSPSTAPTVLLIPDDAAPEAAARAAAVSTPDAVVPWPSGRDRLAHLVSEVLSRPRSVLSRTRVVRIGGSAGGVGTTTVALALAGLAGWSGARTLALVQGTGLGVRAVPAAAVAGPDLFARADTVPGCPQLRALTLSDHAPVPDSGDSSIQVLVMDAGVEADVDVLVCRPDGAALAVLPHTTAAAVALVGDGPARAADLARAAERRRGVRLPWSVRVARAGLAGRVPAGLPGAWLRRLTPLLPDLGAPEVEGRHLDDPAEGRAVAARRRRAAQTSSTAPRSSGRRHRAGRLRS